MNEKDIELKKDLDKVDALVELMNKSPHLWSDEEVKLATRLMRQ